VNLKRAKKLRKEARRYVELFMGLQIVPGNLWPTGYETQLAYGRKVNPVTKQRNTGPRRVIQNCYRGIYHALKYNRIHPEQLIVSSIPARNQGIDQ
jgi:hypothetical protein